MKEFIIKYLFGKTQKMLKEKEISLEKLSAKLNNFEIELKVKSENLLLKQIYLIEQNQNIEKRLERLKTIRTNLNLYKNKVEEKKVTYNEIKERNEFIENLQVVKSGNKEMLIDKYGNFKGYK
jgi:hypothetical protein